MSGATLAVDGAQWLHGGTLNFREAYDSVGQRDRCPSGIVTNGIDLQSRTARVGKGTRRNFVALLDLQLESVDHGKAVMRMPFRPEITNGTGAVHGGAIVSLCDTVFYVALASIYGREQDTTTVSLQCNFLAPALPPHDLIAEARSARKPAAASSTAKSTCAAAKRSSRTRRSTFSTAIRTRNPPKEQDEMSADADAEAHGALRRARAPGRRGWCRSRGFEMPVQYAGILKEHDAVRKRAGLFDLSHMGQFVLTGDGVADWADTLTINAVAHDEAAAGALQHLLQRARRRARRYDLLPPGRTLAARRQRVERRTRCGRISTRTSSGFAA